MKQCLRLVFIMSAVAAAADCARQAPAVHPPDGTFTAARFAVVAEGVSETVDGARVKPDFFRATDVRPLLGRFLIDEEFSSATSSVAVISHKYWVERFRSNPAILGTQVTLDGQPTTIVGVAPPQFETKEPSVVWVPARI